MPEKVAVEFGECPEGTAVDGTYYALLQHRGQSWRMGSVSAIWRQELASCPEPDAGALATLAQKGVWLGAADKKPSFAVMCGGLGSFWPGAGRELYDNFPAARAAMDEIAAMAEWDVLSLMDETDLAQINHTRRQIPYLFMLEYAQWRQFVALGLKPTLLCGHSIGELVALCLAGVYSLRTAWHIFEIRSQNMSELEAGSTRQSGMLAVPAEFAVIEKVLADFPELRISNRNTSTQYILGGPREDLLAARKKLRREHHIPAIMLNVALAFHNPAMRILRDVSERRLNGVEMHAPTVPMLSCVTAGFYPDNQRDICRYIIDLDENTVDWIGTVQAMRQNYGIDCFLELGPQEVLCGLTHEIDNSAVCIPACGKNRETAAMREACARLYALGLLSYDCIARRKQAHHKPAGDIPARKENKLPKENPDATELHGVDPAEAKTIIQLIAEACRISPENISTDMDLRHDLALRSSNFPNLLMEAERRLGRVPNLDNLTQIATVGDLVRFLAGVNIASEGGKADLPESASAENEAFLAKRRPLVRFAVNANGDLRYKPFNPTKNADFYYRRHFQLFVFDESLLQVLYSGLAPLDWQIAAPAGLLKKCDFQQNRAAAITALNCGSDSGAEDLEAAILQDRPQVLVFVPGAITPGTDIAAHCAKIEAVATRVRALLGEKYGSEAVFCLLQHIDGNADTKAISACQKILSSLAARPESPETHIVCWLDESAEADKNNREEVADMLAFELLQTSDQVTVWKRWQPDSNLPCPCRYCQTSPVYGELFPDPEPVRQPQAGLLAALGQYSSFAHPELSWHGKKALYSPAAVQGVPWVSLLTILETAISSARLAMPWLKTVGLTDIRMGDFPVLPDGVTRELRVSSKTVPWMTFDRVPTRACHTFLEIRDISANGRRRPEYSSLCEARCLQAAKDSPVEPLWNGGVAVAEGLFRKNGILDKFYHILGFADEWRLLAGYRPLLTFNRGIDEPEYEFLARLPASSHAKNWQQDGLAFLAEYAFQAALFVIALEAGRDAEPDEDVIVAALNRQCFRSIGFIRVANGAMAEMENTGLRLQLRKSWADRSLSRFDAQVCPVAGRKPLFTLHHLEFYRTDLPKGQNAE